MEIDVSFVQNNIALIVAAVASGGLLLWQIIRKPRHEIGTMVAVQLINYKEALVLDVRERRTTAFGVPFLHVRLRSYGGEYDVVGAPGTLPAGLATGQTLRVDAWVCGRVGGP